VYLVYIETLHSLRVNPHLGFGKPFVLNLGPKFGKLYGHPSVDFIHHLMGLDVHYHATKYDVSKSLLRSNPNDNVTFK